MKKIVSLLAMLLLTIGMATAYTQMDISFYQEDGQASLSTYAQVEGNYWNWPSEPQPETSTGFVATDIDNEGSLDFNQQITQYGNGQQWPNGAANEWSMKEVQELEGSGDTSYNKHFEVWTVHSGWTTDYTGGGMWDMPEGEDTYDFEGTVYSETPSVFNYHVETDSNYNSGSGVWINPFGP